MKRFRTTAAIALLVLGDTLAVGFSYGLAFLLRGVLAGGLSSSHSGILPFPLLAEQSYLLLVYPLVFAYEGLYTKRLAGWEETRRCFRGMFVATAAVAVLFFAVRLWLVSRVAVMLAFALGLALVPLCRVLIKRLLVAVHLNCQPLVVVGSAAGADLFVREIGKHRELGYTVAQRLEPGQDSDLPSRLADRNSVPSGATLVILSESFDAEGLRAVLEVAGRRFADLMLVPNAALLQSSDAEIEQVGNLVVMKYRYNLLRPLNTFTKRAVELVVSGLLFLLLLPLYGLLFLLVRITSSGPVLFRQSRIGRGRRAFTCLKFRTMHPDAERRLDEVLNSNPGVRKEWEMYARITDDPRVTSLGRLLRRYSLDELPQLLNVLAGSMALVGPRPYLPGEAGQIGGCLDTIVRVRPGMTGLWQVSGRAAVPFSERLVLDEYYIRNWSLWLDFSILLRTIGAVVSGRGAY